MNTLQQEIKDFHENIKPTLEKVLEQYGKRTAPQIYNNIIRPCKKLIQKCSFKSVSDTSNLCSLAYWLYICEYKELALEICEHTHGINFEFENLDSGILNIYGLEIRIARELLGENRKNIIWSDLLDYYFSKRVKKEVCYPQILREEELTTCSDRFLSTELLNSTKSLQALYNMIGKGETGLYNELNRNWDKIEKTILEYIHYFQSTLV